VCIIQLKNREGANLADAFNYPNTPASKGIYIGGVRYNVVSGDEKLIYGFHGTGGLAAEKTNRGKANWFLEDYEKYMCPFVRRININLCLFSISQRWLLELVTNHYNFKMLSI